MILRALSVLLAILCAESAFAVVEPPSAPPPRPQEATWARIPYPMARPPDPGPMGDQYAYLLTAEERRQFARALSNADDNRWTQALRRAQNIGHPVPGNIMRWMYMIEPGGRASFAERRIFLESHAHWPKQNELIRQLEFAAKSAPADQIVDWFEVNPPQTGHGMLAYAHGLKKLGRAEDAAKAAQRAWREGSYVRADERRLYNAFRTDLSHDDHVARFDALLWKRHYASASRALRYLKGGQKALADARYKLARSAPGVDAAITRVPAHLRNDPGLIFERTRWRRLKRKTSGAEAILLEAGVTKGGLAKRWWFERHFLTRRALEDRRHEAAYRLASEHGFEPDPAHMAIYAQAEWISGWIALVKLGKPQQALSHFENMFRQVRFPVSLARGAYWIGRAHSALDHPTQAKSWYEQAARHPTVFYGQQAITELHGTTGPLPDLPGTPSISLSDLQAVETSDLARALRVLAETRHTKHLKQFGRALVDQHAEPAWKFLTTELAEDMGYPGTAVYMARQAAQDYVTLMDLGYPVPDLPYADAPERAAVLAVMRQESGFMEAARSHAGARGLMQVMPATARVVARRMGVPYSRSRLTDDPTYNLSLGSFYLNGLLKDYDGSLIMALAAYNAGPARVRRWVRNFGDPRKESVDPIDWIESITITETRNYVQRVMENLLVYRALLSSQRDSKARQINPAAEASLRRAGFDASPG